MRLRTPAWVGLVLTVLLAVLALSGPAHAARTIDGATVNGGASTTVAPGAAITAVVNVTTDGTGSGGRWRCTDWRIATTPPGALTSVDHPNHDSDGTYSETFAITAPATPGTYNAYFIAYRDNGCSQGASPTFVLTNGVIVAPSVVSINRIGGTPTAAASVQWTVTFNASVGGVDAADFSLAASGVTGAAITSVTGSGTTRTVTATTGSGSGTLGLNLADNDTITSTTGGVALGGPGAGNGNFTGQVYTVDRTAPTVVSIARADPNPTSAASVAWTVTFSESVTGVGTGDFALAQGGGMSGAAITGVSGGGAVWTVTATTGNRVGTLGLNLADNDSIIDALSNPLGGSGAGNGNFTGEIYTLMPVVVSINRAAASPTGAASVSWTVVFNVAVTGVDTADFSLAESGLAGSAISSVAGGGTTWTVTAATGSGLGTLGLNLVDNDSISSGGVALGGPGAGNGNFTGQVYTVDRAAPTVASIVRANVNPTNAASVSWTVTFSESVTGVGTADFALVQGGGMSGAAITGVSGGGAVWTVTATTGNLVGTLGLNLVDDDSIADTLGNPLGGSGAGNGNFTGEAYTIDLCPPPVNLPAGLSVTCVCDNFARATLNPSAYGGNYVTSVSDSTGVPPRIVTPGYLRLTENTGANAKAVTVPGIFPAIGNYISVEFRQYAYKTGGGTGADGIAVTLSDSAVAPQPGAFGGSLGYAQKSNPGSDCTTPGGCPGFAGGWLGVALDEYGNFSNPTEGRLGGPGFFAQSVTARGSGSGMTDYRYLGRAGVGNIDNTNSATPSRGFLYQVVVDARSNVTGSGPTQVQVNRDTGAGYASLLSFANVYTTASGLGFTQAPVPTNWRISFTGATGGITNIHEVGALKICAQSISGLLHHVRLNHTGAAVTCLGEQVTVNACADADVAGSCTANTSGLTGNVIARSGGGTILATVPFTIPAGSSSTTVTVPVTAAQTVTFETSGLSQVASANPDWTCWDGSAASCSNTYSDAGFIFSAAASGAEATIPTHTAGVASSTYYLRAVKTSTTTKACEAALSGASTVSFAYECVDPATCYAADLMSINGGSATTIARNNSGSVGSYTTVNVTFDANGNAPLTFLYSDVGQVRLHATKAAGGSLLTGLAGASNAFVVKPFDFLLVPCAAAVVGDCATAPADPGLAGGGAVFARAGEAFKATVTARRSGAVAVPSFGLGSNNATESVDLTRTRVAPVGAGAADGVLGGTTSMPRSSFSGGVATVSDLTWSEAGVITLTATNANFLGVASGATGASGNLGRFIPDHFDTAVVQTAGVPVACPAELAGTCPPLFNGIVYSGQAFTVEATARNSAGNTTQNYDGALGYAHATNLTAWDAIGGAVQNPAGALANGAVPAASFANGVASTGTPVYTLAPFPTAPTNIFIRAVDAVDPVTSLRVAPAVSIEGGVTVVNGRVRVSNAFGSSQVNLPVPAEVQYWTGAFWRVNTQDSVSSITPGAVTPISGGGAAYTAGGPFAAARGTFNMVLAAPLAPTAVNLAFTVPAWLQFPWTGGVAIDPAARASFGIYPGSNRFIYRREVR